MKKFRARLNNNNNIIILTAVIKPRTLLFKLREKYCLGLELTNHPLKLQCFVLRRRRCLQIALFVHESVDEADLIKMETQIPRIFFYQNASDKRSKVKLLNFFSQNRGNLQ